MTSVRPVVPIRLRSFLPQCALALALPLVALHAQTTEPKRDPRIDSVLNDLGKVRAFYQTALSPNGKMIAWVVAGSEGGNHPGTEVEIAPLASPGKPSRVTAATKGGLCHEDSLAWSPDSKTLAFLSTCARTRTRPTSTSPTRQPNLRPAA